MPRCPFAIFRGPIVNMRAGGMVHPVRGLVLHVEEGTETGTDGWFHNPAAQASAHFGIAKDGTLHQWVDTDDRAWAESMGNPYWWSVETEGVHTEPMTAPQVATLGRLYAWLMTLPDEIPHDVADSVGDRGLGWHGMGGASWGGHLSCPGDQRRAQRADALAFISAAPESQPAPTATPIVAEEFDVKFVPALDPETGGSWKVRIEDGAVYADDGAPYLGGLNGHPDWHAGGDESAGHNQVQGLVPAKDGAGKWGYKIWTFDDRDGQLHGYMFPREAA